MKDFEVTFIVDPVLSGDEIKSTAKMYEDTFKKEGCSIVHFGEMGLRQLAYPIKKRHSGVYFCIEMQNENGEFIKKVELAMQRDERIMRFLTIRLDKYGVKYNADKRAGLIGSSKKKKETDDKDKGKPAAKTAAKPAAKSAPTPAAKPAVAAPAAETVTVTETITEIKADEEE